LTTNQLYARQEEAKIRIQTGKLRRLKPYLPLFLMTVPAVLYFFINNYLPMFGLVIAFKNIDFSHGSGWLLKSEWVGLLNFKFLFASNDAYIITRNTILYNAFFIAINLIFSVGIAILLNDIRQRFMARLYQTIIIFPFLISMVIVSYLVYSFLSIDAGFMNKTVLPMLGMEPISWYSEPKYWPYILTLVDIWKGSGFGCIIYLAAIVSIDHDYFEAARIDGASKLRQIFSITLPMIAPVIIMMTLLRIGRIFHSDFGLFYQVPMNSGAIYDTTNVIDTYVYRALIQLGDIGMSSAAGVYQSIVGFLLILLSNYVVRKINKDDALF